ncbi:MAG: HEAT repeat domain-containing protein [Bdellovibrionota bacterium]
MLKTFCTLFVLAGFTTGCAVLIPFVEPKSQVPAVETDELFDPEIPLQAFINVPSPVAQAVGTRELPPLANNLAITPARAKSDVLYRQLIEQLKSPDAAKRTCAATELASLNRKRSDLIPHLVRALRYDQSKWVRRAAAKSLGKIGSKDVIQPLMQAQNDRDKWVAHTATNALQQARSRLSISGDQLASL